MGSIGILGSSVFLMASLVWSQGARDSSMDFDHSHSLWTEVLRKYVTVRGPVSQVNYVGLKRDSGKLQTYLRKLEAIDKKKFNSWNQRQKYVFWVNAYNAYTVKLIIDNYPLDSIKDLGTFFPLRTPWEKKFFTLLGEKRHLDEIEHKILRVKFNEPRTHFAVNCASIGCPALLNEAFTENKLEKQLEKQTKSFLRDTSRNHIQGGTLKISKIFKWFKEDFTKGEQTVQRFVSKYITDDPAIKAKLYGGKLSISYSAYNWSLNKIP